MYESHFGLSASPFRLNPDPAFFFGSSGHTNAMSYMRFGVDQGEGFVVVTGDVGAGKTTLVRTLLEGIDDDEVVAANVANTQLESGELLQAIVTSFGLPTRSTSKAELLSSLERFLTEVVAHGRRALLIVDEAQNLGAEAVEELRMLSNFQLGNHALLQSFLVGQPELRKHLQSPGMEQFRQRVIASCHLGPLTAQESRGYIEHRLRCVGWRNHPAVDDDAYASVYELTHGIPRRINLLFNRLLLAAFSGQLSRITRTLVEETAGDATRETADTATVAADGHAPEPAGGVARPTTAAAAGPTVERRAAVWSDVLPECEDIQFIERAPRALHALVRPLVCIADTPLGMLKFAGLARSMAATHGMPPLVLLNPGLARSLDSEAMAPALKGSIAVEAHLGVPGGPEAERIAAVTLRMGQVLDELQPCAVLSCGAGELVLPCVHLAVKRGLPVARLGAGLRHDEQTPARDLNAILIDRMSQVLYTPMLRTHYTLYREGIPADRMVCVGNLLADELARTVADAPPVPQLLKHIGLTVDQMRRALRGFVVVTAQLDEDDLQDDDVAPVARMVSDLGRETLVIWMATRTTVDAIAQSEAAVALRHAGVVLAPLSGYAAQVGLVRGATCVIAGPGWKMIEEADCLDIPGIVIHPDGSVPVEPADSMVVRIPCDSMACVRALHKVLERIRPPEDGIDGADGAAAARVIEHLRRWLPGLVGEAGEQAQEARVSKV